MADSKDKSGSSSAERRSSFQPTMFGRYYLVDKISRGGMSDIFLAKTTSVGGFQKPLVIKKLLPDLSAKPRYVTRFINEAKTLSRLNHVNIVQILDMGVIDGEYYIATEYIEGRNVAHLVSKAMKSGGPPPLEFSLQVALEIGKGLAYSHRRRGADGEGLMLVHQDVNSFNVMVSYEAEIKIIDFGIARVFLDRTNTDSLPVAGKLLYFSPEQLQGKPVDRRVDVYGAGVLLYELLTGERLFKHEKNPNETAKKILETDVAAKISDDERIIRQLKPILIKATALDPDNRYSWTNEMVEDLRSVMKRMSLEIDLPSMSKYMKDLFQKEQLIDRRRMRRLLSAESTQPVNLYGSGGVPKLSLHAKDEDLAEAILRIASHATETFDDHVSGPFKKQGMIARTIKVPAAKTVFRQGDPGLYLYVIQEGKVRVFLSAGNMEQTVSVLGPGDLFGETAMLGDRSRPLSAEALEDCTLVCLEKELFDKVVPYEPANRVITRLVERIRDTVSLLASALLQDPLYRFIYALIVLHGRVTGRNGKEVEMTDLQELARLDDEDDVEKYLAKLETLQVLEANENTILVKNLDKLENILKLLSGKAKFSLKL
ncbi:protein kinase [Thermodesulfobacteriota bacterium]